MPTVDAVSTKLDDAIRHQTVLSTEVALDLYSSLAPVDIAFMMGRWRGTSIRSHHPLDGLLEMANWYGKEFVDAEQVHPVLVTGWDGRVMRIALHPTLIRWMLKGAIAQNSSLQQGDRHPWLKLVLGGVSAAFQTHQSQARLRMMEHQGKVTATMIYDYLPIYDSFRQVNDHRVMGVMDYKAIDQPFFFILDRQT